MRYNYQIRENQMTPIVLQHKPRKRVNYLNNRDILAEIHKSKNTYCSFVDPAYHQYDIILDGTTNFSETINSVSLQETIIQAKENRIKRINYETGAILNIADIPTGDLVFRIMTWDHVPMLPKPDKQKPKTKLARMIHLHLRSL